MKGLFSNKYDYLYILDYGRYSLKAALLEINRSSNEARIADIAEDVSPHHTGEPEEEAHIAKASDTFTNVFDKIKKPNSRSSKTPELAVGLASEIVYGHNFSYTYKRDNPASKIDDRELTNAVHNAQLKAYEDIRKKFVAESGYAETEVALISSNIQEVRVDGYRVENPVGFEGEELFVSVFNAYLPSFFKQTLVDAASRLQLSLKCLVHEPYAVFNAVKQREEGDLNAIIIDIGGKTTRVSLARKGRLEDIKTFSFGGESFTRRIASHFEVGFWEAENIKKRFSRDELGDDAQSTVTEIMQPEVSVFLNALEMILKDFSRANLLPSKIYIHGGGGDIPLMDGIIRKKKWKRELSFLDRPVLHRLKADMFQNIDVSESKIESSRLVSVLSVSDHVLYTAQHKDDLMSKTMKRVAKLIHDQ